MMHLPDSTVAVAKVAVDAAPAGNMVTVVGARERRPFRDPEVGLDSVEPGGVRRRGHRMDVQPPEQREKARMIMDVVQVIHDDEEPFAWVAGPQPPKGLAHLDETLAPAKEPAQAVGVDIVEAEELLGALPPMIGGPHALRPTPRRPAHASQGLELQRSPLVEADHRRPRRARPVELVDAFFFRSNAGSAEVFQVRMRWARSPSRRRSRRTHSSVIGGSSLRCRQYAANLGTVQAE